MSNTLHITAKLKAGDVSGMRISGTLVAVNAAGISFPQYYGPPPQSSGGATITGVFAATEAADTFSASGTNGFSPLQAGHSTALVSAPAAYVSILSHGAVSSSTSTDNLAAIQGAISAGKAAGLPVFIPAGDFSYYNTITASSVAITGVGPTSILRAMDPGLRSVWLKGSSASLKNVKLLTNGVTIRETTWHHSGIVPFGAINFVVENCYVKHTAAAGLVTAESAGPGTITRCTFSGTLADSIHMTDNAHHITVSLNRVIDSGDDGVACVSYSQDGGKCKNLEARHNWISNNLWGRGMSIVGGQDINYHNNLIEDNEIAAGIYISQETSYLTWGCHSISITYNTIINCGGGGIGHAGIMIFSDGTHTNSSISVVRNLIDQTGSENGIQTFGPQLGVLLDQNKIISAGSSYVNNATAGVTTNVWSTGNVGYEYTTP